MVRVEGKRKRKINNKVGEVLKLYSGEKIKSGFSK